VFAGGGCNFREYRWVCIPKITLRDKGAGNREKEKGKRKKKEGRE